MHPIFIRALSIIRVAQGHFEDLGLVQDFMVKAEYFLILMVYGMVRRCHFEQDVSLETLEKRVSASRLNECRIDRAYFRKYSAPEELLTRLVTVDCHGQNLNC